MKKNPLKVLIAIGFICSAALLVNSSGAKAGFDEADIADEGGKVNCSDLRAKAYKLCLAQNEGDDAAIDKCYRAELDKRCTP